MASLDQPTPDAPKSPVNPSPPPTSSTTLQAESSLHPMQNESDSEDSSITGGMSPTSTVPPPSPASSTPPTSQIDSPGSGSDSDDTDSEDSSSDSHTSLPLTQRTHGFRLTSQPEIGSPIWVQLSSAPQVVINTPTWRCPRTDCTHELDIRRICTHLVTRRANLPCRCRYRMECMADDHLFAHDHPEYGLLE